MNRVFAAVFVCVLVVSAGFAINFYWPEGSTSPTAKPIEYPFPPEPETTAGRHVLLESDEGMHQMTNREWWYFNAYFDDPKSDLYGWSTVISFNTCKFDLREPLGDTLFALIYDTEGNVYGKTINEAPQSTLKMGENMLDLQFENSWARGLYPDWAVYAKVESCVIDLKFEAKIEPEWFVGRSPNLGFSSSSLIGGILGYYGVFDCDIKGTVIINGETYDVSGHGYHDHCWSNLVPRILTSGWDFFNIRFDNGWTMALDKMYPVGLTTLAQSIPSLLEINWPGICVISNGESFYDFVMMQQTDLSKYTITYPIQEPSSQFALLHHPLKWTIIAESDVVRLELHITAENLYEEMWHTGLIGWTGFWEGTCHVEGTFTYDGQVVPLTGQGITETTRIFLV